MAILKAKGKPMAEVKTVAAKAATTPSISAVPGSTAVAIPSVKPGAMSVELGPKIAEAIAGYTKSEEALQTQKAEFNERNYVLSAMLTEACVKMTTADPSIDFTVILNKESGPKVDVNKRAYLALGLKKAVTRGKPGKEETVFDWNPDTIVGQLLGDSEKDTPEIKDQKESYRSNLAHKLTQCQKAALFLIENRGIKFKHDEASGTLMLSGPDVQKIYGAPVVLLDQKVKQPLRDAEGNDQGSTVNLKAKPSYTDLARRAAEAHGKVTMTRADSRPKQFEDKHAAVVHMCDMLIKVLEKYEEPNDAATRALENALSAIEEKLS